MPVFTVTGRDHFPKVLVAKNTLEEVVACSIKKLKLPLGDYKLILEKNGALIDEDDLLAALQPESELVIIPADEEWQGREHRTSTPISVTPNIIVPSWSTPGTSQRPPQQRSRGSPDICVPWASLDCVQEELDSGLPLNPRSFRIVVHALANSLIAKKDYSRASCGLLTREVFAKHQDAFSIKDSDGNLLSDGQSSFLASLYERVNLMKPAELKKRRGAKRRLLDDEDDNLNWDHQTNPIYDAYGCVAWQPPLPEGATREAQETKRAKVSTEDSPNVLKELMQETYWLQRKDINTRKGDLDEILSLWPTLKHSDHFLSHCNNLLGKDCSTVWYDAIQVQGHNLFKYFDDFSRVTKSTNHNRDQLEKLQGLGETGKKAMADLRSKVPIYTAMFLMIMHYFCDNTESIIRLIDIETSVSDVPATDRPLLIVKGRSLFEEGTQSSIVCEGKVILQPTSLNEGIMLHFLSFYAFNYNYPEKGRKYMEFVQRSFFKINPTSGHKRGPKAARTHSLDPHVKKLITSFSNFSQRLSRLMA